MGQIFAKKYSIMTIYIPKVKVATERVHYTETSLTTKYTYHNALVEENNGEYFVTPIQEDYEFKVDLKIPKLGVMLVGLGGNNGSTLISAILANREKLAFNTKRGLKTANYYGSVTQSATIKLGVDINGNDVYAPFNSLLPMINPNDILVSGWDINKADMEEAVKRSHVLEYDLQQKLATELRRIEPLPSIYYPDFIAANQESRANNCFNRENFDGKISTEGKWQHVERIRNDIQTFKRDNNLDEVIVLWTANTERYSSIIPGVNDTAKNLLKAIKEDQAEISPSSIFAVASILEKVPYINGSPQNTFVPGVIELAGKHESFIGGDDLKTGQTKFKSVLAAFLVDAGIKPMSIASYNHLGNNDGYNLSSAKQFRSKEISKSSVVDDVIDSNKYLYNKKDGSKIDHCIVIKYIPAVGDDKVAMDEYYSELMLGGHNRVSIHNVCEDSLLAAPIILDLLIMTEFLSRVTYKKTGTEEYKNLNNILSFLGYWLKAPLTRKGYKAVNSLNKQRLGIDNLLRLLIGLQPLNELRFEERLN